VSDRESGKTFSCNSFKRLLYHYQADELPEPQRRDMDRHLEVCPGCARRLAVEDVFLTGIKSRLHRSEAPPGLRTRVRAALGEEPPARSLSAWFRAPWLVPAAASVLLVLLLSPALGRFSEPPWAMPAGVVHVEREVTVVALPCDRAGLALHRQKSCGDPSHLNALKIGPDQYWSISLDQDSGRDLAVDHDMRGHVLRVEGDLYTGIRTLHLSGFKDLGVTGLSAAMLPLGATPTQR